MPPSRLLGTKTTNMKMRQTTKMMTECMYDVVKVALSPPTVAYTMVDKGIINAIAAGTHRTIIGSASAESSALKEGGR